MTVEDITLQELKDTGALLDGHFILSSGLHSPQYLQCAIALQHTGNAARYGRAISDRYAGIEIDTVAAPAIGGLVIGYATAASLGCRFIWTERQNGIMTLRRGFEVEKGERVLAVEDVITTGGSIRECMDVLSSRGAEVVGVASIVDRSGGKAHFGVPHASLLTLDVPTYPPDQCPLCAAGERASKPGSRTAALG